MDDLISRQAALGALGERPVVWSDNDDYTLGARNQYDMDRLALETVPPAQQWIPCSEVPDTDRNVFIARGDGNMMTVCIGHYQHDYKQWYEDRNWFEKCLYDGLYWCEMPPLPEP